MPIADDMAQPISAMATKAFVNTFDENKPTLRFIFYELWDKFLEFIKTYIAPDGTRVIIRDVVFKNVELMRYCGTGALGFEVYECPYCHNTHIIGYTCKSRFCPSCGVKETKQRAEYAANSTLDVNHRHIVFSIDESLRVYFKRDRKRLNFLFEAAWETLTYTFNKAYAKKGDVFTPGVIITLHTFGRDLKWNPHVHCIVTEGGMNNAGLYKAVQYISYEGLRKSFMKVLLDKLRDSMVKGSPEYIEFMRVKSHLYQTDTNGFYVYAPPRNMKNQKDKKACIKYDMRYTGRPAMAESRIISYDYDARQITYYYDDHKTEERIEVTESVFQFFLKLIQHIPDEGFKMVRCYGLYATTDRSRHKKTVKRKLSKSLLHFAWNRREKKHYRRTLIETFGVDPLLCTCGHYMEFYDYYVPDRLPGGGELPP